MIHTAVDYGGAFYDQFARALVKAIVRRHYRPRSLEDTPDPPARHRG
jgi:hypothetical protein